VFSLGDENKKKKKDTENIYDKGQAEEMLEEGEIEPEEAGFMEGYTQKQSEKNKKPKEVAQQE
jgi:hypothetical protein